MSSNRVVDSSGYLHQVCADKTLKNSKKINGEGQIEEVDESFFTRRKNEVGQVLSHVVGLLQI